MANDPIGTGSPAAFDPFERRHRRHTGFGGLIIGAFIVLVGVLFLLRNLGVIYVDSFTRFWPIILILLGVSHILNGQRSGRQVFGFVMVGLGTVFLLGNLGILSRHVWSYIGPLLLIGAGLHMIWRRRQFQQRLENFHGDMDRVRDRARDIADAANRGFGAASSTSANGLDDRISIWSMFSGAHRRVTSQDFRGGEVNVAFGGAKLDFRGARIQRECILECNAIFGGIEMILPPDMPVLVEAQGIFGGVEDQGLHPATGPGAKLVITGSAIFGGIHIKN